jgi:hypothetical protein
MKRGQGFLASHGALEDVGLSSMFGGRVSDSVCWADLQNNSICIYLSWLLRYGAYAGPTVYTFFSWLLRYCVYAGPTVYALFPDCCVMALTPGQQYIHIFSWLLRYGVYAGPTVYAYFFLTVALWRFRRANSICICFPDCCVMAFTPGQQYMHVFSDCCVMALTPGQQYIHIFLLLWNQQVQLAGDCSRLNRSLYIPPFPMLSRHEVLLRQLMLIQGLPKDCRITTHKIKKQFGVSPWSNIV